jgi:hypothetical protein
VYLGLLGKHSHNRFSLDRKLYPKLNGLITCSLEQTEDYAAEIDSAEEWDKEYASGRWDYLGNVSEATALGFDKKYGPGG